MANKPLNMNGKARRIAAQLPSNGSVGVSFLTSGVPVLPGDLINVEGMPHVFARGGGAVVCSDTPLGPFVPLEDRSGVPVVVTTSNLIEVRGIRYISFEMGSVVSSSRAVEVLRPNPAPPGIATEIDTVLTPPLA